MPFSGPIEAVSGSLRAQILDGDLVGGTPLREVALAEAAGVARHSVRAALRALEAEGLVRIERNRGARVARLEPADVHGLQVVRELLEVGATRIALERGGGRLPASVGAAARRFAQACAGAPAWRDVVVAHEAMHAALVVAAGVPRLTAAHAALATELRLFLVQARDLEHFAPDELASDHLALVASIDKDGPAALSAHLRASAVALGAQP